MPKLQTATIEKNKDRIEAAAKQLFITRGFHATSMRDIGSEARVSIGNLYNYYKTKDEILESIIGKYQQIIDSRLQGIFEGSQEPLKKENLQWFGHQVRDLVNEHYDFWLLMYIDVLEFQNQHFKRMFENLTANLNRRFEGYFSELKSHQRVHPGIEPAFGFAALYMQFFNYFLVEKLFGGNHHFGIQDEEVITKLVEIFHRGIMQTES